MKLVEDMPSDHPCLYHVVLVKGNFVGEEVDVTSHHGVDTLDVEEVHPWVDVHHSRIAEGLETNLV